MIKYFNIIHNIVFAIMMILFTPVIWEFGRFFFAAFENYQVKGNWHTLVKFDNFPGEPILDAIWYMLAAIFLCIGWVLLGAKIIYDCFRNKMK